MKGTLDQDIYFKAGKMDLVAFVGADYAGYKLDRKSIPGYKINLGN